MEEQKERYEKLLNVSGDRIMAYIRFRSAAACPFITGQRIRAPVPQGIWNGATFQWEERAPIA